jgi:hypothetical protein
MAKALEDTAIQNPADDEDALIQLLQEGAGHWGESELRSQPVLGG